MCALCIISFSCHCRTLLPFKCSDDFFLSLSLACTRATVPTLLNFAIRIVFLLDEASTRCRSVFSDLALCLAVCVHASTHACLAPFPRLPILTLSRVSSRCGLGLLRYTGYLGDPFVLSAHSAWSTCASLCTVTEILDNLVYVLHLRESSRSSPL